MVKLKNNYTAPWTALRLERLSIKPIWVGVVGFATLILIFAAMETILGRWTSITNLEQASDLRLVFVTCLLLATGPMGTLYFMRQSRRTFEALSSEIDKTPRELEELRLTAGRYRQPQLAIAGWLGVFAVIPAPFILLPKGTAWNPMSWHPELAFAHLLVPLIAWWGARNIYIQSVEATRLSELAEQLRHIDLFDLSRLDAFGQQALVHVFLALLTVAILSPLAIDLEAIPVFMGVAAISLSAGVSTLIVCLRGVRKRILKAKQSALNEARKELSSLNASGLLVSDKEKLSQIADLLAYQNSIQQIDEWTLDGSRISRLIFYLLLPIGSWMGAAFVERIIDSLFS